MSTLSDRIRAAALGPQFAGEQIFDSWFGPGDYDASDALFMWLHDYDATNHSGSWYGRSPMNVRRMALLFVAEAVK